jgi:hypothetical protein
MYTQVDCYCFSTITGHFIQPNNLKDTRVPSPKLYNGSIHLAGHSRNVHGFLARIGSPSHP